MTSAENIAIIGSSGRCFMEEQNRPTRHRRNGRSRRRRQKNLAIKVFIFFIIIVGVIGGAFLIKKYGPSKERADLNEYYGIKGQNQLAVIVDGEVTGADGMLLDGRAYVDYSVVRDYMNDRFYVDYNENILLYTLPEGTITAEVGKEEYTMQKEKKNVGYPILKMEGNVAYIATEFVQTYTNIDIEFFESTETEPNRVVISRGSGDIAIATVKKAAPVRYRAGVKSPILTDVSKKDEVRVIDTLDDWKKVCTADGYVGYIKNNCLKKEEVKTLSRPFEEQVYPNISKDYTINLAWHLVTNRTANNAVLTTIADTQGLTTISPTWFTITNTDGDLRSLASPQYVNYAHQLDIEVWACVSDFQHDAYASGIQSFEETYELLSHTSSRENLINQLIAEAVRTNVDGINVDFEKISSACGEHYIQFIRELAFRCHQNGIVISVDNPVPKSYNKHYNIKEQGNVVDYVIIMGYDEHTSGSYESGSVASYDFVKSGIEETLKVVPKEKTVNAVPFYTRLWKEVPKSAEELAQQEGTEAAEYGMKVTSLVYGIGKAEAVIADAGAEITFDEETRQNYAEWEADGAVYKIWLEDTASLEERLKLMKEYGLAGNAAWRLGFDNSDTWELINRYIN